MALLPLLYFSSSIYYFVKLCILVISLSGGELLRRILWHFRFNITRTYHRFTHSPHYKSGSQVTDELFLKWHYDPFEKNVWWQTPQAHPEKCWFSTLWLKISSAKSYFFYLLPQKSRRRFRIAGLNTNQPVMRWSPRSESVNLTRASSYDACYRLVCLEMIYTMRRTKVCKKSRLPWSHMRRP